MSRTKSLSPRGSLKSNHSRELQQLQDLYEQSKTQYNRSPLSKSIASMVRTKQRTSLTKAISLGLGSLIAKDQSRRIKQLTIFLAIVEQLESSSRTSLKLYAQDPTFTKVDEAFLASLGITTLRTPSPSNLGEAGRYIDGKTMVYSPFLTIEAYRSLLDSCSMGMLVGDDFNALKLKWPKHTAENEDVGRMLKHELVKYQRRAIIQASKEEDVFWEKEDKAFPMALYWRLPDKHGYPTPVEGSLNRLDRTISARL
jgi:hypothetical protein